MEEDYIKYLSWDSNFFGKKTGKIICNNPSELPNFLYKAKQENYKLIYVFGNENYYVEDEIIKQYNGKLIDRKALYHKRVTELLSLPEQVEIYKGKLTKELEDLTYISGEYSRFKLDKNFKETDFYRMYKKWIINSLSGQIADFVFVLRENRQLKGMVTLKNSEKTGHIGLIAVSPETQGKGYGKMLIKACENQLLAKDIFQLEAPTQKDNVQACSFYEKCGFKIKEITNIYHFWL